MALDLDPLDLGILVGVLVGEGSFGGDGRQAQVTLRMHVRHERLFELLTRIVPGSKLYGPYRHGERSYFQWMVRGEPLREMVVAIGPQLERVDAHAAERFRTMCERYHLDAGA